MRIINYDRKRAIQYAKKWAYSRNPNYYNFDNIGGDCTNYISQCIYAGSKIMNYDKENGWYYNSIDDRSPSWTSAQYLYNFLTKNKGYGPYGNIAKQNQVYIGDIVQFKFDKEYFSHSAIIVKIGDINSLDQIFVASHSMDVSNKKVSNYKFNDIRFIHIDKVRSN